MLRADAERGAQWNQRKAVMDELNNGCGEGGKMGKCRILFEGFVQKVHNLRFCYTTSIVVFVPLFLPYVHVVQNLPFQSLRLVYAVFA